MLIYLERFSTFLPSAGQKALMKYIETKLLSVPVCFRVVLMESIYEMV